MSPSRPPTPSGTSTLPFSRPGQEELFDCESAVRCPYYRRGGTCATGCWDEPWCQTSGPAEGWEQRIRDLRAARKAGHDA